jgi:hypothetical protein
MPVDAPDPAANALRIGWLYARWRVGLSDMLEAVH